MASTKNLHLSMTPEGTNKSFLDWRLEQDGTENSNMQKLDAAWGDMAARVDGALAAVGKPTVAETAADMTDQTRAYVYTGSETGYTYGNWYYYDAEEEAWVSGGVYQASAVETDETLRVEGMAADAKATGELVAINETPMAGTKISITTTSEDVTLATMDDVDELKTQLINLGTYDIAYPFADGYINLGGGIGSTVSLTPTALGGWYNCVANVEEHDTIIITAYGGSASRAWGFIDEDNKLLSVANTSTTVSDFTLTIPSGAKKVIVNSSTAVQYKCIKRKLIDKNYIDTKDARINQSIGVIMQDHELTNNEQLFDTNDVKVGDVIGYKMSVANVGTAYIGLYDANNVRLAYYGKPTSGASLGIYSGTFEIPSGFSYAKMVIESASANMIDLFLNNSGYVALNEVGKLETEIDMKESIETPSIVLPSAFYAIEGKECNIYYSDIVKSYDHEQYVFRATVSPSLATIVIYPNWVSITPDASTHGSYTITFSVYRKSDWTQCATATTNFYVSENASVTKKVLFIGDSLTYRSVYQARLAELNGIESIGTVSRTITYEGSSVTIKSEGRNGWATYNYADSEVAGFNIKTDAEGNVFYNPDTQDFDFSYYMTQNGATIGTPDYIVIALGTNGMNQYGKNASLASFDKMIASIKTWNASAKIFIHLMPPVSRNGYKRSGPTGANSATTLWYDMISELITKYDGVSGVNVIPVYAMLDDVNDYQYVTVDASAINDTQITIASDDYMHPAYYGYLHMADAYYNTLLYFIQQ